jgi:hypothetical protein
VTLRNSVLDIGVRRSWRIAIGVAVPLFAILMVAGIATIVGDGRGSGLGEALAIVFIVATLGGPIVVPGAGALARIVKGVPDARIDDRGIVWGRDRTRDLAIDWTDVDEVMGRVLPTRYITERVFAIMPFPGRTGTPARTPYGRVLALANRLRYGSPFVISMTVADRSWEEVRDVLATRLPGRRVSGD